MNLLDDCVNFRIGLSVSTGLHAGFQRYTNVILKQENRALEIQLSSRTEYLPSISDFVILSLFFLLVRLAKGFWNLFFKEPTFCFINPLYYLEFFLSLFCYCLCFYYFFLATAFGYGLILFFQSLTVYCIKLLIWDLSIFSNIGSECCKILLGLPPQQTLGSHLGF